MVKNFKAFSRQYPYQFWLLFWGMLISSTGVSIIWPFLTIYIRESLDISLTTVAGLIALNSFMILASSLVIGPVTDRVGRKWIMVISLAFNSGSLFLMSHANTIAQFAVLMAVRGAFIPLYRIGADAMVADLIEPDKRMEAYSLMRTVNNLGVALGPTIGGFITTISYTLGFYSASIFLAVFSILAAIFLSETLTKQNIVRPSNAPRDLTGYGTVFKDRPFLVFCASFTITKMAPALVFVLLSVYTKENFQIPESQFGFMMATNATMVVLFQYAVSKITKKHSPQLILMIGSVVYGIGVGSIAWDTNFWSFIFSIILMTLGELMVAPTAITMVAKFAPQEMRGRYMGVYWLTVGITKGLAPMIGGLLNDNIAPVAIWYGGLVMGLIGAVGFSILSRMEIKEKIELPQH